MTWAFIFHRQIRAKQKIETALLVISKRKSIFDTASIVGEHKRRISFLECNFSIYVVVSQGKLHCFLEHTNSTIDFG